MVCAWPFPTGKAAFTGCCGQAWMRWEVSFAMPVHKSQGSEFEHVCLVLPDRAVAVLTRELFYTEIAQAKTRLTLVVPPADVASRAVRMKVLRNGGLK